MSVYRLRPHHGMCLAYFRGKGYSEEFVKNMTEIQRRLQENPLIQLTDCADAICSSCPNDREGHCITQEKVNHYDCGVLEVCECIVGQTIEWNEFSERVQKRILDVGKREAICGDCQWSELCK